MTAGGAAAVGQVVGSRGLGQGAHVGRFVLEAAVGAGGMGIVYRAMDPVLGRSVAVKLVHGHSPGGQERLLREAQALARLTHPNVITVYEAGRHGDATYIAMEYVDGGTLATLMAKSPPAATLFEAFAAAGRGLAAAHAAGLVHRDFKPSNVLVARDGRIRVADFGIVRASAGGAADHEGLAPAQAAPATASPSTILSPVSLTRTGGLVGTPAYMAPEQARGLDVDGRGDQFSFCVALYEGLFGTRPFPGERWDEVLAAIERRALAEPVRVARGTPPGLRRVLGRGLSLRAEDRWPSMEALLAAIQSLIERRRRRRSITVGAALTAAIVTPLVVFGVGRTSAPAPDPRCQDVGAQLAGVWDDARHGRIADHFASLPTAFAKDGIQRATRPLDEYAAAWIKARAAACANTDGAGSGRSSAAEDATLRCLDQRRAQLDRVAGVLERADTVVATRALELALSVADLTVCADGDMLAAAPPLPRDLAVVRRIVALDMGLAEARAWGEARQWARGIALVEPTLREVDAIGWAPLQAQTQFTFAFLAHGGDRYADAADAYRRAANAAEIARDDRLRFRATVYEADVRGYFLSERDESRRLETQARALLERLGHDDELAAFLDERMANVELHLGNLDRARTLAEAQLGRRRAKIGGASTGDLPVRDDLTLARATLLLGRVLQMRAEHPAALQVLEEARRRYERVYGADHPAMTSVWHNLAISYAGVGRYRDAENLQRRIVDLETPLWGRKNDKIGRTLHNLGNTLRAQGRYQESLAVFEEELGIKIAIDGVDGAWTASSRRAMAETLLALGRLDEALAQLELARDAEARRGPNGVGANTLALLGFTLVRRGQRAEGLADLDRAVALAQSQGEAALLGVLVRRAQALLVARRPGLAVTAAEAALAITTHLALGADDLAEVEFTLAEALDAAGRDRPRALELARAALSRREGSEGPVSERERLRAWLAARAGRASGPGPAEARPR
jgi:tetratricopeptide (TPR) repeat protein